MRSQIEISRVSKENRIGIITGSGPEAGIDLWKKILSGRRKALGIKYRGDIDAPKVKILSLPTLGLSMDMESHGEAIWPQLENAAIEMAETCGAYSIACNTLHYFADRLHSLHGEKFISIQNSLKRELNEQRTTRFALLGASPVTSLGTWSSYQALAEEFEIEAVNSKVVDDIIYDIKRRGMSTEENNGNFEKIVGKLKSRIVVLGCTELPLIPRFQITSHTFIDATSLIARDLLNRAS